MQPASADAGLQPASTDADLLPVVDERDQVIGVAPRRQVHLQRLRHRAVHIGVFDGQGRLWLQQRSRSKDVLGGWWDLSATGHVDPGEDYDQAARRELREELGIDAKPRFVVKLEASERTGWEFHALYWLRWDGPIEGFNRDEIDRMRPFAIDEIREALAAAEPLWRVTPNVADELALLLRASES
jgi:isopentenyldiphosphate isomerase